MKAKIQKWLQTQSNTQNIADYYEAITPDHPKMTWPTFATADREETPQSMLVAPFHVDSNVALKRPVSRSTQTMPKITVNATV